MYIMCAHIYIYIYVCMYVCMYVYIYIYVCLPSGGATCLTLLVPRMRSSKVANNIILINNIYIYIYINSY